jgi:hypothetical protein
MKSSRVLKLVAAVPLTMFLTACGQKPSNVLVDMNNELCKTGDLTVMTKYVSERSKPAISGIAAMMAEPTKAAQIKTNIQQGCSDGKSKIEVLKETVEKDRAEVVYKEGNETKTAKLVKENDAWKIDIENHK